jgi:uroporphyrinogen decarboxylase
LPADSRFLKACRRQPVDATPVWFMRQAGRYLPEYRALRERHSILELCHAPELAAEVTLQPVRRMPVDAAIIFADILLPFEPLGLGLSFAAGEGPVIARPIRDPAAVAALPDVDPAVDLAYVLETVRRVRAALAPEVALIGFAGAPFTLASYAIEGGASRDFARTKRFMYGQPDAWHALLDRLAGLVGTFLAAQVRAGAGAVQMFDSWVGCLAPADYRQYVQPHSRRALELARAGGTPVIHFGTGNAGMLADFAAAGGDVVGVDWRVSLDQAWRIIGADRAIQGNLDPLALFAPAPELERRVRDVLAAAAGRPGHIFNLGHGVLPDTPIDALQRVVDLVHSATSKTARPD